MPKRLQPVLLTKKFSLVATAVALMATLALAREFGSNGNVAALPGTVLDDIIRQNSERAVLAGSAALLVLIMLTSLLKNKLGKKKGKELPPVLSYALFSSIVLIVLVVTGYVAGSTIYLNLLSPAKGPVHWHADFEIWNCGQRVDLIEPKGLSNRVGTPTLHEHGDDRIHVEGVVVNYGDISLGEFFRSVGGDFGQGRLMMPTDSGMVTVQDGADCPDGHGMIQVFAYRTVNGRVIQQKVGDYSSYVLSPHTSVPPGDCIIIEFTSKAKDKTEHICESHRIALQKGVVNGG